MEEASKEIIDLRNRVIEAQQRNASLKSQVQKLKYTIKNIAELL
ncbi:hypothetical protein [Clostridium thermopalmarium]|uniref:Uncharacterized protein n=1 Tax=Clostridium thermopalmarium DSM 5974 TaxID=1121340 RepID=A0A2T0APG8_9CLOT|nr:hypothetical protein [Clostridium thermopalmarium]PRR70909.1 hypothetical protein CPAL_19990 [Clostridium thermopalmarium DSM 5974]PVZ28833.1 hypothetical protein LX19_00137 [Clostridium thermopalmarium DSM 5974]